MVDYKKLLDAVVGSLGRIDPTTVAEAVTGSGKQAERPGRQATGQPSGRASDQLLQKAKDLAVQHPGLTQAALVGLAGLMFKNRKGGLSSGLVKLGGLAVIGTLAYKSMKGRQAGSATALDSDLEVPVENRFHPVSQTEDDTLLLLRTMIAAAAADGSIDETERLRIIKGMKEAGIDPQASTWLQEEMASPAEIDELTEPVNDPDTAAQVYAAARIVIDPDTLQEGEFLHRLAKALDLDDAVAKEIDAAVSALRKAA